MRLYFSNTDRYYRLTEKNALSFFRVNTNELDEFGEEVFDSAFKLLKRGEKFTDTKQTYFIEESDYEIIKKKLYDYIEDYNTTIQKRVEAGEDEHIAKASEFNRVTSQAISDLKTMNKFKDLSYEDEDSVSVKFTYNNERQTENLKFGEKATYEVLDESKVTMVDLNLMTKMYENPFFRGLIKPGTDIVPVKCDYLDTEKNCYLLQLQDSELLVSQDQIYRYLTKYEMDNSKSNSGPKPGTKGTAKTLEDLEKDVSETKEPPVPPTPEKTTPEPILKPTDIEGYEKLFKENGYNTVVMDDGTLQVYKDNLVGEFALNEGKLAGTIMEGADKIIYENKNISMEELSSGFANGFTKINKTDKENSKNNIEETINELFKYCADTNEKWDMIYGPSKNNPDKTYIDIRLKDTSKFKDIGKFVVNNDGTLTGSVFNVKDGKYHMLYTATNESVDKVKEAFDTNFKNTLNEDKERRAVYNECVDYLKNNSNIKEDTITLYKPETNVISGTIDRKIYFQEKNKSSSINFVLSSEDEKGYIEIKTMDDKYKVPIDSSNALETLKIFVEKESVKEIQEAVEKRNELSIEIEKLKECKELLESKGFDTVLEDIGSLVIKKDNLIGDFYYDTAKESYLGFIAREDNKKVLLDIENVNLEEVDNSLDKLLKNLENGIEDKISNIERKPREKENSENTHRFTREEFFEAILQANIEAKQNECKELLEEYGFKCKIQGDEIEIDRGNIFGCFAVDSSGKISMSLEKLENGSYNEVYNCEEKELREIREDLDNIFEPEKSEDIDEHLQSLIDNLKDDDKEL